MRIVERLLCPECGPRKLIDAGMRYKRSLGGDDFAECAFCHRERLCKCYLIAIGR